jgi:hypothetical protein
MIHRATNLLSRKFKKPVKKSVGGLTAGVTNTEGLPDRETVKLS